MHSSSPQSPIRFLPHALSAALALALDSTTALSVSTATLHVGAITAICLHLRFILTPPLEVSVPIKASHLLRSIPTPHQQAHTHLPPGLALKLYLLFISPSPHKPHLSPAARHWKKKREEKRKKPSPPCVPYFLRIQSSAYRRRRLLAAAGFRAQRAEPAA
jgi:hypothetical protein